MVAMDSDMQQMISSQELGTQLVNVLGLPSRVTEIDISLRFNEPVTLTVKRLLGVDEACELVSELRRFGLIDMDPRDPIDRAADKALAGIKAKYQAALDWLDAKHVSNCFALAEGCR